MGPAEVRRLAPVDLGYAALALSQFAFRLQRAVNRELARVTWAAESVRSVIARTVAKYPGYSFEERRLQAVRDNDVATRLDQIRVRAQLRVDRLSYLSGRASDMARTLLSIKNSRQGDRD
jgi:hypothetical protein